MELLHAATPSSSSKKMLEGAVEVPVLSVRGAEDPRVCGACFAQDPTLAGSAVTHLEIPAAGHFPNEETPAQVTQILAGHLAQVCPPASTGV